ncbi:hypothetical protein A6770_25595 [Nostoc minutum NIES-26]|uniref:Uncharacterized protein n=1 Tax=Nostoc minutum NIES-26 TaxID=1844469 RepID=A0A367QUA4_9NOSO|nr:hypothetical protein A6770_25595 [Nostoc minutum NIES-26]
MGFCIDSGIITNWPDLILTKIITVSFAYGLADPNLFPYADLAAACAAVLAEETATTLNYGRLSAMWLPVTVLQVN